jgi:hypothetical protein
MLDLFGSVTENAAADLFCFGGQARQREKERGSQNETHLNLHNSLPESTNARRQ